MGANKMIKQEARSMKNNIIITGIKETTGKQCIQVVKAFFKDRMKIAKDMQIVNAHRLGAKERENKAMVVCMADFTDKLTIFKHKKHLKDVQNEDGAKFYVNDQLPEEQAEDKRKKSQKVKFNKNLIDAQQQDIEWKRGDLMIDGNIYRPQVEEPSCADILRMQPNEIKQMLSRRLHRGPEKKKNGSTFIGFATKTDNIQQVLEGYKQLKYQFMDADHVICAYRIMDTDLVHNMDCVDGGELGTGRRLLQMLVDQCYENIAVYIVRFHNGPNLGPQHFNIITDTAKAAIDGMPTSLDRLIGASSNTYSKFQNRKFARPNARGALARVSTATGRSRGTSVAAKKLDFGSSMSGAVHSRHSNDVHAAQKQRMPIQSINV